VSSMARQDALQGVTTISITHDIVSARKIADRIGMMFDGKIMWSDAVDETDENGNEHVEQFIDGRTKDPIQMQVRRL